MDESGCQRFETGVNHWKGCHFRLTPGTTYYFRTTCDDGTTYSIPVMQATESVIQLPDFTQGWGKTIFSGTINKGGKYTHGAFGTYKFGYNRFDCF